MNSKQEKDVGKNVGKKKQETEDLTQIVLTKRGLKDKSSESQSVNIFKKFLFTASYCKCITICVCRQVV